MISCKNSKNLPDVAIDVVINDNLAGQSPEMKNEELRMKNQLLPHLHP